MRTLTRRTFLQLVAGIGLGSALVSTSCTTSTTSASEGTPSTSAASEKSASVTHAPDPQEMSTDLRASFILMSDIHINEGNDAATLRFRQALADITTLDHYPDAIAVVGDLSDTGSPTEHEIFKQVVAESAFDLEKDFIIALGNHDHWVVDDPANERLVAKQKSDFVETYKLAGLFYETTLAGQHIVVLGPDRFNSGWVHFDMTNEQLTWLDALLAADDEQGVHTYIMCHEPLTNTVRGSEEGSWGSRNSFVDPGKVLAVIDKYPQAVFISGHTHVYPGVEASDPTRPIFVNDGSCARSYRPESSGQARKLSSWGLQMLIFDDHLEFGVRNFEEHLWEEEPLIVPFKR